MNEQLFLEQFEISELEQDIKKFEHSQIDNENEEDIKDIENLPFSDLVVTGTDWTVETIVGQIKKGNIQLDPSFQRRDAWSNKIKSQFIESLFLGLPIPQIILAEQKGKKGKFIVIDGKQRLLSLKQFVSPDDGNKSLKLSGLDVFSKFNHKTYSDILDESFYDDIDTFNNQTIRTVVVKNWKNVEILYLLFLRLNTGSIKLSPQELRQALYPGKFVDYVNNVSSNNKQLQRMLNIKKLDFRMRDVEILIRYLSFYFFSERYTGSMQNFLDTTCDELNKVFGQRESEIITAIYDFNAAVDLTFEIFSDRFAFRKYKINKYEDRYNRAVIDIMLFYFAQIKDKDLVLNYGKEIKSRFERLCNEDREFIMALESTTKSLSAVHCRFRKWGEVLSDITGKSLFIPKGY